MIRILIRAFVISLVAIGAGLAPPTQAQVRPGNIVELTPVDLRDDATAQVVALPRGKARVIRLPKDARDVLVATPGIADILIKTPRLAYLLGRNAGETNAFFFDAEGNEIARLEIRVEVDVLAVRQAIEALVPNSDVNITAVRDSLFLTGNVRSSEIAENINQIASRFASGAGGLVNLLSIAEDQQVLVQVRIAEVTRGVLKNIGVDLLAVVESIGDFSGLTVATTRNAAIGFFNARTGISGNDGSITAAIQALERNGLLTTFAEPNLTAISGETANFLSGGEFPVQVETDEGFAIEFKQFGVGLNFTPVVLDSGRISLRIQTEVSAPIAGSGGALTVQRAETTVEVPSGGSMIIGGLLQHSVSAAILGTPGLKDIPLLGALFRQNDLALDQKEIIIAVTAFIVKPVDRNQVMYPTRDSVAPTDYELYFLGRLEAIYGDEEDVSATAMTALKGPIGYIVQ